MYELTVADTSCLIVLSKIDRLETLKVLASTIAITPEIKEEFGQKLPDWIKVLSEKEERQKEVLALELDKGEASAIGLCLTKKDALLLIDEKKGRKVAQELDLKVMGTLGVLIKAKEKGVVNSLADEIKKLQNVHFRMSEELIQSILDNYE